MNECRQSATSAVPHGHEGQTRKSSVEIPESALQTHLQGVNWATLAKMPEECRHRAALLSRFEAGQNSATGDGEQAKPLAGRIGNSYEKDSATL
jgi:hypothetical protein